jgi:hypothetical protein
MQSHCGANIAQLTFWYVPVEEPAASFGVKLDYRAVANPVTGDALSDAELRKQLHLASFGFQGPLIAR